MEFRETQLNLDCRGRDSEEPDGAFSRSLSFHGSERVSTEMFLGFVEAAVAAVAAAEQEE